MYTATRQHLKNISKKNILSQNFSVCPLGPFSFAISTWTGVYGAALLQKLVRDWGGCL